MEGGLRRVRCQCKAYERIAHEKGSYAIFVAASHRCRCPEPGSGLGACGHDPHYKATNYMSAVHLQMGDLLSANGDAEHLLSMQPKNPDVRVRFFLS
jgi:hypothetical protein